MNMDRRTVVKTAAWTGPAVVAATASPAFATSRPDCKPPKTCKRPGVGKNTKDYFVQPRSEHGNVISVMIDGKQATLGKHGWEIRGQKDSRNWLLVVVTNNQGQTWTYTLAFPPCKQY